MWLCQGGECGAWRANLARMLPGPGWNGGRRGGTTRMKSDAGRRHEV